MQMYDNNNFVRKLVNDKLCLLQWKSKFVSIQGSLLLLQLCKEILLKKLRIIWKA